jgi:hypothetical protein
LKKITEGVTKEADFLLVLVEREKHRVVQIDKGVLKKNAFFNL